jgi:hypothetical protein
MANSVYSTETVFLIDGTELYLTPLKIKYLREFMKQFEHVKNSENDSDGVSNIVKCALVAMRQYHPVIKTIEAIEDLCDMPTIYKIIEIAAGIKIDAEAEDVPEQASSNGGTWDELDIVELESEVFLLGIWKDYEELETSLSMPELSSILSAKREADYNEKKFLAAIQGVDLEASTGRDPQKDWEDMKARVFSGGSTGDSNDILSMQGVNAQQSGFGIGMGLDYENLG